MEKLSRVAAALALALLLGHGPAQVAAPALEVAHSPTLGHYLAGAEGMALYVFTEDSGGGSACTGECAREWPPLLVPEGAEVAPPEGAPGEFGTIVREDGGRQVTYNERPLYYWTGDLAPGEALGQGQGGAWWIASLDPVLHVRDDPDLGEILVGPTGLSLYRYGLDTPPGSRCVDECAREWPPLLGGFAPEAGYAPSAPGLPGEVGVVLRPDGTRQLTYNGQPLYYWWRDEAPGDTTGQGVDDVWFVVNP